MTSLRKDESAQLHTIEALAAALIIILVLAIVVQATSLTPLSASFTNQHIKLELQNLGNDILTTLDQTPINETTNPEMQTMLSQSVIDWIVVTNCDVYSWNNTTYISMYDGSSRELLTPLTNALTFALVNQGIAFNVEVCYPDASGISRTTKMIWNGDPSENSVTVSRFIVLHDNPNEIPPGPRFDNEDGLFPDVSPTTKLHNVAEVRLTLWVM
jgi:hypothetical protein